MSRARNTHVRKNAPATIVAVRRSDGRTLLIDDALKSISRADADVIAPGITKAFSRKRARVARTVRK